MLECWGDILHLTDVLDIDGTEIEGNFIPIFLLHGISSFCRFPK
jgi:hypothetical protein